jgi:hypothetical protein
VDTERLAKAVAQEFAAKHKKQERKTAKKKVVNGGHVTDARGRG